MKQRIIAFVCIVCMLCVAGNTVIPNTSMTAKASASTATTIEGLLEEGFTPWTFSDVGIDDQTITENLNMNAASQSSLDRTIFHGKILFPASNADANDNFGRFYIGGETEESNDFKSGIRIIGWAETAIELSIINENGEQIWKQNIWQQTTDKALRGNSELQIAISVEYLNVTADGLATIKLGLFKDGVLHAGQFYTVSNVPEQCLTQYVKWQDPKNSPAIKSDSLVDITLENAPERNFAEWTFSDVQGITEGTLTTDANWNNTTYISNSLDKTIFTGKVSFMADSSKLSSLLIGGINTNDSNSAEQGSKWRGFRFDADGADKIKLGFCGTGGRYFNESGDTGNTSFYTIATFDATTAGVTLRGNDNLQIAVSVEYLSVENNLVTMQVGVFFDGKLYDNTYYKVANVPTDFLYQNVRVKAVGASNKIASDSIEIENTGVYLENAPEREFDEWSLDDLGFEDNSALTSSYHWENVPTTAKNLDKSLLNVKIYIPGTGQDAGQIYIGGATSGSLWRGFRILGNDSNSLQFHYLNSSGAETKIANFYSSTAGTQLRNNRNLQLSISFEYLSATDTTTKVKIGVFFDGKLYNNTYYEHDIETQYLNRHIKWYSPTNSPAIASHHSFDTTLKNAPEKDFEYWTLRDINISDAIVSGDWNNTIKNTASLDKTMFNAKINFAATSVFGEFYIGGATDDNGYRGFRFKSWNTTDIRMDFYGPSGERYTSNGKEDNYIVYFDSATAGTTLRGNSELQFSLSVEIIEGTRETIDELSCVDIKVGVFFDGKLYDNTYFTLADIPEKYLTNNIRWLSATDGCSLASLAKAENVLTSENATVSASHVDMYSENTGYGMATLVDGVVGQNDPYYLGAVGADLQNETTTFDFAFDDAYSIDSVRLHKYRAADGFPVDFTISAYTAEGWKTLVTQTDYQSTVGWNEFNFADTVCSGLRLTVTENGKHAGGDTFGTHLTEVEAWGVPSSAEIRAPYTIGEEATIITYTENDILLNDGNLIGNNGYRVLSNSQNVSAKIQYMFGFPVAMHGIQWVAQEAGEFPSAFKIYAFTGSAWEVVHEETNYAPKTTQTTQDIVFNDTVNCSSIMIEVDTMCDIYGAGDIYGLQIQEIRINGQVKDGASAILGDGNTNGTLIEAEDMAAFRTALVESDTPGAIYDLNRDEANDCRDLVRMKRYFVNKDQVAKTYDLEVISFNVRCIHSDTSGYLHPTIREPKIAEYLLNSGADLIGLQEIEDVNDMDWRTELSADILVEDSPYQVIGAEGTAEHDLMIFYNAEKLKLEESGVKALPSVEGYNTYYYQWAKFTDMRSGETVFMTNTHFLPNYNADNQVEDQTELRKQEAEELLNFWTNTVKDEILVAVGDYNCYQNSEPVNVLTGGTWKNANDVFGPEGAFGTIKSQIDHAFVNPIKTSVENLRWSQDTFAYEASGSTTQEYYSDHPTLFVKLSYKK